jgi:hypothetical protein
VANYIDNAGRIVTTGVSSTGPISGTDGYFNGQVRSTVSGDITAPAYSFASEKSSGFDMSSATGGNLYFILRGSLQASVEPSYLNALGFKLGGPGVNDWSVMLRRRLLYATVQPRKTCASITPTPAARTSSVPN